MVMNTTKPASKKNAMVDDCDMTQRPTLPRTVWPVAGNFEPMRYARIATTMSIKSELPRTLNLP